MNQQALLEIKDLNIVFNMDLVRRESLRDRFIALFKSPFKKTTSLEKLHVIKDLNLTISRGERVGLIGVNGTGKTSLCRCVAGMYAPRSGTVKAHGEVRAIFDTGVAVLPELTGRENAQLLAKLLYPGERNLNSLITEAIEFSELGRFIDMPFKHYSKGMQARLCLSLISAKSCDLLILDEVFDGADAFFQKKISERVSRMIYESGAVLFVSHSPLHIEQTCNRLVVLNLGRVAYDGPVKEGMEFYYSLLGPKVQVDLPCDLLQ